MNVVPSTTSQVSDEQLQQEIVTVQRGFRYSLFGRLLTPSREQISKINQFIQHVNTASDEVLGKLNREQIESIQKNITTLKGRCWEFDEKEVKSSFGVRFRMGILEFLGFAILRIEPLKQDKIGRIGIKILKTQAEDKSSHETPTPSYAISQGLKTETVDTIKEIVVQALHKAIFKDEKTFESAIKERTDLEDSPFPVGFFWLKDGTTPMMTRYMNKSFYHVALEFGKEGYAVSYTVSSGKRVGSHSLKTLAPAGRRMDANDARYDLARVRFMKSTLENMKKNGHWLNIVSLEEVKQDAQEGSRYISCGIIKQQRMVFSYGIDADSGIPFYLQIDEQGKVKIQSDEDGEVLIKYFDENLGSAVGFTEFQKKVTQYELSVNRVAYSEIEENPGFQKKAFAQALQDISEMTLLGEEFKGVYAVTRMPSEDALTTYELAYIGPEDGLKHQAKIKVQQDGSLSLIEGNQTTNCSSFKDLLKGLQLGEKPYANSIEQLSQARSLQAEFLNNFVDAYDETLRTESQAKAHLQRMDALFSGRTYIIWKDGQSRYRLNFLKGGDLVQFFVRFNLKNNQITIGGHNVRNEQELFACFKEYQLVGRQPIQKAQAAQSQKMHELALRSEHGISRQQFESRIEQIKKIQPQLAKGGFFVEKADSSGLRYNLSVYSDRLQTHPVDLESRPGMVLVDGRAFKSFEEALKAVGGVQDYEQLGRHLFAVEDVFSKTKEEVFSPQTLTDKAFTEKVAHVLKELGTNSKRVLPLWAIQYTPQQKVSWIWSKLQGAWNVAAGGEGHEPLPHPGTYSLLLFQDSGSGDNVVVTQKKLTISYDPTDKRYKLEGGVTGSSIEEVIKKQLQLQREVRQHALKLADEEIDRENSRYRTITDHPNFRWQEMNEESIKKALDGTSGHFFATPPLPFVLYRKPGKHIQLTGHEGSIQGVHGSYHVAWRNSLNGKIEHATYAVQATGDPLKYSFHLSLSEEQKKTMPKELLRFHPN